MDSNEAFCAIMLIWLIVSTILSGLYFHDESLMKYYNHIICNNLYEYTGDYVACVNRGIHHNIYDIKLTYKKRSKYLFI